MTQPTGGKEEEGKETLPAFSAVPPTWTALSSVTPAALLRRVQGEAALMGGAATKSRRL